ncbi:MAG: protein-glutamate O-methyltransferase CheR [Bdellovibrionota bacterium]
MTTSTTNSDMLKYFSALIEKETGIQYRDTNEHQLNSRLRDLAKFLNFPDVEALWAEVQKNGLQPAAKSLMLDMATNNETSFFRDQEVFDFFKTHFILKTMATNTNKIRIWCAATSTGQEPYSLALIMAELSRAGTNKYYEILCSDISERVLQQASKGLFSQLEIQRGLPAPLMLKYFDQVTSESSSLPSYRAKPELSAHMTFKRLNLLDPWPNIGTFDIIFCRNVLIYQSVENKKQVIARFTKMLAPGGYLVLGGAESLLGLSTDYTMEQHGRACVYKLKGPA